MADNGTKSVWPERFSLTEEQKKRIRQTASVPVASDSCEMAIKGVLRRAKTKKK